MTTLPYQFSVDDFDESEWTKAAAAFPSNNVYQCWEYAVAHQQSRKESSISRVLLRCDGQPVMMAQFRVVRVPLIGLAVATAAWGPLWFGDRSPSTAAADWAAFLDGVNNEYIRKRRWQVRFDPASTLDAEADRRMVEHFTDHGFPVNESVRKYRTVLLDLRLPVETLLANANANWRSTLRAFERSGLQLVSGDDGPMFRRFRQLYDEMWKTKTFVTAIDIDAIERFQAAAPPACRFAVWVAVDEGRDVGAGVFGKVGNTGLYFLGASSPAMRKKTSPGYGIVWAAVKAAQANGMARFDLGGLTGQPGSGVDDFKTRTNGTFWMFPGRFESKLTGVRAKIYALALRWRKRAREARAHT